MMLRGAAWAVPPLFFAEKETVMKSFTMFGSHVCPDTIAAMCYVHLGQKRTFLYVQGYYGHHDLPEGISSSP